MKSSGKLRCLFAQWRQRNAACLRERETSAAAVVGRLVPWFSPVGPRRRLAGLCCLRWLGLDRRRHCRSNAEFHAALARRSTGVERWIRARTATVSEWLVLDVGQLIDVLVGGVTYHHITPRCRGQMSVPEHCRNGTSHQYNAVARRYLFYSPVHPTM